MATAWSPTYAGLMLDSRCGTSSASGVVVEAAQALENWRGRRDWERRKSRRRERASGRGFFVLRGRSSDALRARRNKTRPSRVYQAPLPGVWARLVGDEAGGSQAGAHGAGCDGAGRTRPVCPRARVCLLFVLHTLMPTCTASKRAPADTPSKKERNRGSRKKVDSSGGGGAATASVRGDDEWSLCWWGRAARAATGRRAGGPGRVCRGWAVAVVGGARAAARRVGARVGAGRRKRAGMVVQKGEGEGGVG